MRSYVWYSVRNYVLTGLKFDQLESKYLEEVKNDDKEVYLVFDLTGIVSHFFFNQDVLHLEHPFLHYVHDSAIVFGVGAEHIFDQLLSLDDVLGPINSQ